MSVKERTRRKAVPPPDVIQIGPEGAILVGGARMCLIDIVGGFFSIWRCIHEETPERAKHVLYEAGARGAKSFVQSALLLGQITKDGIGFKNAVKAYARAGFGGFKVKRISFKKGTARIECERPMAFEAYALVQNGIESDVPACDYSRGVFAGFMIELAGREDVVCTEEKCRAMGAEKCLFVVEPRTG